MMWLVGGFLLGLFGWACCRPRQYNYYYSTRTSMTSTSTATATAAIMPITQKGGERMSYEGHTDPRDIRLGTTKARMYLCGSTATWRSYSRINAEKGFLVAEATIKKWVRWWQVWETRNPGVDMRGRAHYL